MLTPPPPPSPPAPADAGTDDVAPGGEAPLSTPGIVGRGVLMGMADVIPGVSGGTIALIVGIYPRFVDALGSLNVRWAAPLARALFARGEARGAGFAAARAHLGAIHWGFLVPLGVGMGVAIMAGSRVVPHLLAHYAVATYAFFFGLILASIPVPLRLMPHRGPREALLAVVAAIATFFFVGLPELHTTDARWFLFPSGALAICAMVLPGVSGSYVLLMLGRYERVIGAVRSFALADLAVFAAGMVAGVISFARLLRYLLHHRASPTLAVLVGVMAGALRSVWPFRVEVPTASGKSLYRSTWPEALDGDVAVAALAFLAGVAVLVGLEWLGRRRAASLPPPTAH